MLRMAETYFKEDNYEKAYILYHKFVTLFIEKVNFTQSKHLITNYSGGPNAQHLNSKYILKHRNM